MSTSRAILRESRGVVLTKVTLSSGSMPVSVAYSVSSKRTPETQSFDHREAAELYFVAEVERARVEGL